VCVKVRKKDQINIESKLKTVRFIGENAPDCVHPTLVCLSTLFNIVQSNCSS